MSSKKDLDLVTIRASAYSRVAVKPDVLDKGLACAAQHNAVIRPKQVVWVDLGFSISTPCRAIGFARTAVELGLLVQPDAFMPGDHLVVAVANAGEFIVELARGQALALLEPVVWRMGDVAFGLDWVQPT